MRPLGPHHTITHKTGVLIFRHTDALNLGQEKVSSSASFSSSFRGIPRILAAVVVVSSATPSSRARTQQNHSLGRVGRCWRRTAPLSSGEAGHHQLLSAVPELAKKRALLAPLVEILARDSSGVARNDKSKHVARHGCAAE